VKEKTEDQNNGERVINNSVAIH